MDEELSDGSIYRTSGEFINALISILDWLKFAVIDHSSYLHIRSRVLARPSSVQACLGFR